MYMETTGAVAAAEPMTYCTNHPTVETLLRCNRCGQPVCLKCMMLTDVGYRCKACVHAQTAVFFNATVLDYVLVGAVAFVAALVATPVAGMILGEIWGFSLFLAMFAGPAAGGVLASMARFAGRKHRGRYLGYTAVGGAIAGVLLVYAIVFFVTGFVPFFDLPTTAFALLAISTAYHYLR